MIVEAIRSYPSVIAEVIIAATFLSVNSPFLLPAGKELEARRAHHSFHDPLGDFVSYQRIYEAFVKSANKAKFCEAHYLELRTMNEIINIEGQLQEIVSKMGVPIGSGGAWDDYLCAISRGLIQFVCERTGRGIYRSLTADKGEIHPACHVPGKPAFSSWRGDRAHEPDVRPLGLPASPPASGRDFSHSHAGLREEACRSPGKRKEKTRDFTTQMKIGQENVPHPHDQGRPQDRDHGMGEAAPGSPAARPGRLFLPSRTCGARSCGTERRFFAGMKLSNYSLLRRICTPKKGSGRTGLRERRSRSQRTAASSAATCRACSACVR